MLIALHGLVQQVICESMLAGAQVRDCGRVEHCMWALTSREAEREQQRLLELRDRALNHMAAGIFIAARDTGALVYVNQGFVRLTGFSASEAIGQPWTFLEARPPRLSIVSPAGMHLILRSTVSVMHLPRAKDVSMYVHCRPERPRCDTRLVRRLEWVFMSMSSHITQHVAQAEGAECAAAAAAAAAVMEGRAAEFEAHLRIKSGERLWAQVQLRPVRQDGSSAPADNLVRGVAAVGSLLGPLLGWPARLCHMQLWLGPYVFP